MKTRNNYIIKLSLILLPALGFSQTADEIIDKYIELSGGQKQWSNIHSMKIIGKANAIAQSMELPFVRIMDKEGRQITTLNYNGMDYISLAYDGEKAWGSNQVMELTLKGSDETHNAKIQAADFPFPGFDWKKRGYKASYLGETKIDSINTYHVRLIKQPQMSNGKKVENVADLYFSTENYMPILVETIDNSGFNKGKTMKSYLKDYKRVDGYLYPFTTEMQYDEDTPFQIITTEKVEWNLEFDDKTFKMPLEQNDQ